MSMGEDGPSRQQLALKLLEMVQQGCYRDEPQKVMQFILITLKGKAGMWDLGLCR